MAREQRISAFFYGILLHPKILKRVIGNDGSYLEICPAVLLVSVTGAPFCGKIRTKPRRLGSYET